MPSVFRIFLFFWLAAVISNGHAQSAAPLSVGEVLSLPSSVLGEDRTLNIYLPQGYVDTIDYPVIYLLDGSLHEDFLHVVGLVQFFALQFQMPPHIVVGIANVDRKRDFTFPTNLADLQEHYPTTGHSAPFISFLEDELLPFIGQRYSVSGTRYLFGQSLGGLLATEVLLKKPALFTHYFIISPSLWWDDESLLLAAPDLLRSATSGPQHLFIAVGKGEHKIMRKDAKNLAKILKTAYGSQVEQHFLLMQDENHATILHNALYRGLLQLYPYSE